MVNLSEMRASDASVVCGPEVGVVPGSGVAGSGVRTCETAVSEGRTMKVALLICAALALAGCGGKDSPTAPKHTYVDLSLAASVECDELLCTSVVGTLAAVSSNWESNEISLSAGRSVRVEVPAGGAYRALFDTISCDSRIITWDFTVNATAGQALAAPLTCHVTEAR
jgi:hypothetical protein